MSVFLLEERRVRAPLRDGADVVLAETLDAVVPHLEHSAHVLVLRRLGVEDLANPLLVVERPFDCMLKCRLLIHLLRHPGVESELLSGGHFERALLNVSL